MKNPNGRMTEFSSFRLGQLRANSLLMPAKTSELISVPATGSGKGCRVGDGVVADLGERLYSDHVRTFIQGVSSPFGVAEKCSAARCKRCPRGER